jgi:hypothetical protein
MIWFEQLGTPSGLAKKEPFEIFHLGVEAFLWFGSYVVGYGSDVI